MKRTPIALFLLSFLGFSQSTQLMDPREAHWIRLSTPDFDLFTCAPEKDGRELLRSFEQIRGFFQKASPVPLMEDFPVRIVAFAGPEQFAFYAPSGRVVAYYSPGPRTDYIVMRDAKRESYAYGIHEYMHLLVKHSGIRVPAWLNEGWADVYSTLRPVHDGVAVGDLIPGRVKMLESSAWMDINTLTSVAASSRLVDEGQRVGLFYAESWALVHMLFLSPEYSAGFPKLLSALNRGRPASEAFRTVWGRSSEQVFADLQNYMRRRKVQGRVFETSLGNSDNPVEVSKLEPFDTRLTLADLTAVLGRRAEAKQEFEALSALQPNNTQVSESLGFAALAVKDFEEARQNFEKAFAAGDTNPLMCLQLAILDGRANQRREKIQAAFNRALQSKPDYPDAQLQLALFQIALHQFQAALDTLMSIKKINPEKAAPVFANIAYCQFQTGDLEKARASALTAKQWALDPNVPKGEDKLIGMIDARAKSPFAPHAGEKTERVDAMLKGVECRGNSQYLVLTVGDKPLLLDLPEPQTIEFIHSGPDKDLKLTCGVQQPMRMLVDFSPASVMKSGPAGIVRRIEF